MLSPAAGARLALALLVAASCSTGEEVAELGAGSTCSLASDCAAPLVCVFTRCHQECSDTRDCPSEQRCVIVDKPRAVCQLAVERDCDFSSDCPQPLVCAVDGQCRAQCHAQTDCLAGQACASGTCADADELVEGRLPVDDPEPGTPCAFDSDCPEEMHCKKAQCVFDCLTSADCPAGGACLGNRCVVSDGGVPCVPGEQPHCTCDDGADGVKVCGDDFQFSACICPGKPSGSGGTGGALAASGSGAGGAPASSSGNGGAPASSSGNGGGPATSSSNAASTGNGGGPASSSSNIATTGNAGGGPASSSSNVATTGNGGGFASSGTLFDATADIDIARNGTKATQWIGAPGGALTRSTALPGVGDAVLGADAFGAMLAAAPSSAPWAGRGAGGDEHAVLLFDLLGGEVTHLPANSLRDASAPLPGVVSLAAMAQGGPAWVALTGAAPPWLAPGGGWQCALARPGAGAFVVAVARPRGVPVWRAALDGEQVAPAAVAMDDDGGAVVVGSFSGTLRIGRRALRTGGDGAGFAARFAHDGALVWLLRLGDGERVTPRALALGKDSAGRLDGTAWIGGATASAPTDAAEATLLHLDARGSVMRSARWGDTEAQEVMAVSVGADGAVAIGGHTAGPLDLGAGRMVPASGGDAFVATLSRDGSLRYARLLGEPHGDASALAFDAAGDLLVAGASDGDALVLKLDRNGVLRWLRTFGDDVEQRATSIVAGEGDAVMVTVVTEGEGLDVGLGVQPGRALLLTLTP
ncbi:MAG: hypothetical protein WKG00_02975 [Polyangiaceae bacterium]